MVSGVMYTIVIVLAGAFIVGLVTLLRAIADDKADTGLLRDLADVMAGGSRRQASKEDEDESSADEVSDRGDPFEDVCPACHTHVTHRDATCPECGLRLL